MSYKLLRSFLGTSCNFPCFVKSHRRTLPRLINLVQKLQFFSQDRKDDSDSEQFRSQEHKDGSDKETDIKKLLDDASPLKPSPEAQAFWATSPFPKGTVFKGFEEEPDDRVKINPEETSIIMFPGQGNQFVGMANNLLQYSVAKDMFASASEILGYDLLKVCQEGPEKKLNETEYCQPATLVCSLAALEKLKDEKPWAVNNCVGTCGYSLGEFSALVFAGCISFEKGVQLVKLRAEAMSLCCKAQEGGMMTVMTGPQSTLSQALKDAVNHCKDKGIPFPECAIASYLFPQCKVIGGNIEALNFLIKNSKVYKLKTLSKLPVSGAFHTSLMKDAAETFREALKTVEFSRPVIKVYSNVTGRAYKNEYDIKKNLPKQIYFPVKWEQTVKGIYDREKGIKFPFTYECGPGTSLTTILKKSNTPAFSQCSAVKL